MEAPQYSPRLLFVIMIVVIMMGITIMSTGVASPTFAAFPRISQMQLASFSNITVTNNAAGVKSHEHSGSNAAPAMKTSGGGVELCQKTAAVANLSHSASTTGTTIQQQITPTSSTPEVSLTTEAYTPSTKASIDRNLNSSNFRDRYLMWEKFAAPAHLQDKAVQLGINGALVFSCFKCGDCLCGGWADQIKGAVFTYVAANLTGRMFKMNLEKLKHCGMSNYLIPNKVNWTLPSNVTIDHQHDLSIIGHHLNNENLLKGSMENFINATSRYFTVRANMDYISGLRRFSLFDKELAWMRDITRADVYAVLYKRLFKLAPRLQSRVLSILKEALPTSRHRLVCIHVRLGHGAFQSDYAVRNSIDNLPKIWSFVANKTQGAYDKLYVMSDSKEVVDSARNQTFKDKLVTVSGDIVHVDKYMFERQGPSKACSGFEKLLVEHHLLMNCDVLVMGHSGLSVIAAMVRASDDQLYRLHDDGKIVPARRNDFEGLGFW